MKRPIGDERNILPNCVSRNAGCHNFHFMSPSNIWRISYQCVWRDWFASDLSTTELYLETTDFGSQILYLSASWTVLTCRRKLSRTSASCLLI